MGKNNIQVLAPSEAIALAANIVTVCGPGPTNAYGIDHGTLTQLGAFSGSLTEAGNAVDLAYSAYQAAVQTRKGTLNTLRFLLANAARQAYTSPDSTATKIAQLGLSPRSKNRAKIPPIAPDGLVAQTEATGEIRLVWNRAGNPEGTMFLVEARTGGGAWKTAAHTSAAKTVLRDMPPTGPTQFRVTALRNDEASVPSPILLLFPASGDASARKAA